MSLAVIDTALHDTGFLGRCDAAAMVAAAAILNEDPGTSNHANRLTWAQNYVANSNNYASGSAEKIRRYALATNSTAQTTGISLTDSDVQFIVNSILSSASALTAVS